MFKKRIKLVKEGKIDQSGIYDSFTFDDLKKTFGGMKGAVGAIRNGYPRGISVTENKEKSLSPFSNDEDNIDFENIEKFMKEDEEREREQARIDAEQERRRKDRESQKKAQEKQRKDFETEQKRIWEEFEQRQKQKEQAKVWEEFEKRQNQKKKLERTMTPMKEIKIAGGKEKFALGKTITKCSRVLTLDQRQAPTCWFNALMMALFFSQNTRIAIAYSLPYIQDQRKLPIVVKIGKLLEGYNKERANKRIYEELQPKEFLASLRQLHPERFPQLKRDAKFNANNYDSYNGDSIEYLHRMLQFLEIPHLILSRPSMKSGKTEWSQYNYDLFGTKIFAKLPNGTNYEYG
jgi:flagellar biosynthesis GTPase FlhF